MARILVDENIPKSVQRWLEDLGHDVVRPSDVGLKGVKDNIIIEAAIGDGRVIVTLDLDFAEIYYGSTRDKIAVVVIRIHPPTPENIKNVLSKALKKIDLGRVTKGLIIISRKKVRIIE